MHADFEGNSLRETVGERTLRRSMSWISVVGAVAFASFFFFSVAQVSKSGVWDAIGNKHFAVVIGLPSAALAALFIVLVLRTVAGPIEMKVLGFEFKGASGPIIMWIACYLSLAMTIRWLWPLF